MEFPSDFSWDGKAITLAPLKEANWTARVRIRNPHNTTMTLHGIQCPEAEQPKLESVIGARTLPLCKSNLQKCVRRQDTDRAVRTALAMYAYDPNELLRRVPVIMIEDCLPYPAAFTRLVWWMCAVSKGYILSTSELEMLLGIVATMCESSMYEAKRHHVSLVHEDALDWSSLPGDRRAFFWCLEIRAMYQGMKCDVEMMRDHQHFWLERFQGKATEEIWWDKLQAQQDYTIELESATGFSLDDILPEAVDFHCASFIPRKMCEKFPDLTEGEVKLAIWMCRSRVNFRPPIEQSSFDEPSEATKKHYARLSGELEGLVCWYLGRLRLKD